MAKKKAAKPLGKKDMKKTKGGTTTLKTTDDSTSTMGVKLPDVIVTSYQTGGHG